MKKFVLSFAIIGMILCSCGKKSNIFIPSSDQRPGSTSSTVQSSSEKESSLNYSSKGSSQNSSISLSSSQPSSRTSISSAHVHNPARAIEENKHDATCTEDGYYDSVVYCSSCHEELSREQKTISALGHDLVHYNAKEATCTEVGWDAYDACSRCDYSTKVEKSALGHHFVKNNETLIYECDHEGCHETNGRDFVINITYSFTEARAGNAYADFAPTSYSFVNDDHALDFGFYVLEILDDNYNLLEVINPTTDGGNFKITNDYVGKRIRVVYYVVVLDDKDVKYSSSGNQIANLKYICNRIETNRVSAMTAPWYDGVERKGYSTRIDLGIIHRSSNIDDLAYTYKNKVFTFDRASSTKDLSEEIIADITKAYTNSECRVFDDNKIEFLANGDFDGSQSNEDRVVKFGTINFTEILDGANDFEFTLSGSFDFTKEIRNGVTKDINESVLLRRFVREDDTLRLGFLYGTLRIFLWFVPTETTPTHFEEHTHNYVTNEDTLENVCDYKGCGASNGRNYEMTIELKPLHVGDVYHKRDAIYSFKNDDNSLDFDCVFYEIGNTLYLPDRNDGVLKFIESDLGQSVKAYIEVAVYDDTNIKTESGKITNLKVVCNGQEADQPYTGSVMTSYDGEKRMCYQFTCEIGVVLPEPYYGETPKLSEDGKTMTYGLYPQSHVNDTKLIEALNELTAPEANGWYLYNDKYYATTNGKSFESSCSFVDGESITYGTKYWFECEPIPWKVLTSNEGEYFLVSNVLLDAHRYDDSKNDYKDSEVRAWLNDNFYNAAFALNDSFVLTTEVDNSADTTFASDTPYVCENTQDKVFLLSFVDYRDYSQYGFTYSINESDKRCCLVTDWARANGAFYRKPKTNNGCGNYWTRTPSNLDADHAIRANYDGAINYFDLVDSASVCVRPAINISVD